MKHHSRIQSRRIQRTDVGRCARMRGVLAGCVCLGVLVGYVGVVIHTNAERVALVSLTDQLATVSTETNGKEIQIATLLGSAVVPSSLNMVPQDLKLEYFQIEPAGLALR